MFEKRGMVRNPLTIIAIFAGIAEVSGTTVLPFVDAPNQMFFIYFLIGFPILLVLLFFLTLNFNNRVLYAPSDFKDETNFLKISKYDRAELKEVEVNLNKSELINYIDDLNEKYNLLSSDLDRLQKSKEIVFDDAIKDENFFIVDINGKLENLQKFVNLLNKKGFLTKIYNEHFKEEKKVRFSEQKSIWLGKNVPANIAIEVIKLAKKIYPFLEYIFISGDRGECPPSFVHNEIFIGGSTKTAIVGNLKKLSDNDFEKLYKMTSITNLHEFIRSFY